LGLDKLREAGDQSCDVLSLVFSQPLVRNGNGVRRLAVHMSERQAIGIDDPIAAQIAMIEENRH
jgi:hypothetical protein